jgi:hypothetical protein
MILIFNYLSLLRTAAHLRYCIIRDHCTAKLAVRWNQRASFGCSRYNSVRLATMREKLFLQGIAGIYIVYDRLKSVMRSGSWFSRIQIFMIIPLKAMLLLSIKKYICLWPRTFVMLEDWKCRNLMIYDWKFFFNSANLTPCYAFVVLSYLLIFN